MWFAASIIMHVEFKDNVQDKYPIWENVILIEANNEEEALRKAEERGHFEEGDADDSFTWESRPARWVYGGIRKMLTCAEFEDRPKDGTEITYSEMEVASAEDLSKLINGEQVSVVYEL